jgi:hypothetical protein
MPIRVAGTAGLSCLFVVGLVVRSVPGVRDALLQAGLATPLVTGMRWTAYLCITLVLVSFIGALVSRLRGNRGAFRCDSVVLGLLWGLACLLAFLMGPFVVYTWLGTGFRPSVVRYKEGPPRAPTAAYDALLDEMVSVFNEWSDILETMQPGPTLGASRLGLDRNSERYHALQRRADTTPLPTRDQAADLAHRYYEPIRAAVSRLDQAAAGAMDRCGAGDRQRQLLGDMQFITAQMQSLGERQVDLYLVVFGNTAGSRAEEAPSVREAQADDEDAPPVAQAHPPAAAPVRPNPPPAAHPADSRSAAEKARDDFARRQEEALARIRSRTNGGASNPPPPRATSPPPASAAPTTEGFAVPPN